jgi:drug/metabolite transporter (DMT)-like permease
MFLDHTQQGGFIVRTLKVYGAVRLRYGHLIIPSTACLMTVVLTFAFILTNSVVANLFLKVGSADAPARLLLGFMSWRSFIGLCFFGVGGLAYSYAMRLVPLNVAQSVMSIQYITIILASAFILGEVITPMRILGIALIASGVLCVAFSYANRN